MLNLGGSKDISKHPRHRREQGEETGRNAKQGQGQCHCLPPALRSASEPYDQWKIAPKRRRSPIESSR